MLTSLLLADFTGFARAGLEAGAQISLTIRGVDSTEDFTNLRHKNIVLHPGDSLQVEQKGIIDRWRGQEDSVRKLME